MQQLELAVLADDLTGGLIIASLIERCGVVCPLVTDAAEVRSIGRNRAALVLARKIRLVDPSRAREEARLASAAFKALGARTIYYKYSALFDSTSRGNIGPIAESLLTQTGSHQTVFCPAYIDRTVTVYQGHLFIGRTPLDESFKRDDPVTPAETSDIVAKLAAQTALKVGLIDHQALRTDIDALRKRVESDQDQCLWVAD